MGRTRDTLLTNGTQGPDVTSVIRTVMAILLGHTLSLAGSDEANGHAGRVHVAGAGAPLTTVSNKPGPACEESTRELGSGARTSGHQMSPRPQPCRGPSQATPQHTENNKC